MGYQSDNQTEGMGIIVWMFVFVLLALAAIVAIGIWQGGQAGGHSIEAFDIGPSHWRSVAMIAAIAFVTMILLAIFASIGVK